MMYTEHFFDHRSARLDQRPRFRHSMGMIGDIRKRREALRLQQKDLAAICSIRPETLSRIEKGTDQVPGYVDMILALLERDPEAVTFALERLKRDDL
jgi:transcriptional regulator with XRE-family HTH domain